MEENKVKSVALGGKDSSIENNPHVVSSEFTMSTFLTAMLAGGIAGTSIDFVLFPIDSIKTRL